jgi:hypothetical protein
MTVRRPQSREPNADLAEPTMTQDDLTTFLCVIPPDNRTWQSFDDKRLDNGQPRRSRYLARVLTDPLSSVEPTLRRLNTPELGAGVYISGNLTDGYGRASHNITRIVTVIADLDHGLPPTLPVPPTFIIETSPGKFQAWWHLDGDDALNDQEHRDIHARLVADYGADPRAAGIARVYRVPGFWLLKGEPFLVRIVGGGMRPVDKATLVTAFPPIPSPAPTGAPPRNTPPRAVDFSNAGLDRFAAPLQAIPADNYGTWITVGLAQHAETGGGSDGLALWDAWSAASAKYWPGECATRWVTFKPTGPNLATGGKDLLACRTASVARVYGRFLTLSRLDEALAIEYDPQRNKLGTDYQIADRIGAARAVSTSGLR